MTQQIHLAAIVVRDGQLLLHREHEAAPWGLPGGPLLPEHEDVDAGMDAILESFGINAPAVEEDFVETIHLPAGEGHIVYNIYAPTEWTGDPLAPGMQSAWFGLYELDALDMDDNVRDAVLAAFGLRERHDPSPEIMAALGHALPPEVTSRVEPVQSAHDAGLDVLRTLSGGDPDAYETMKRELPELADSILEQSMGWAWQGTALDRRTRSLLVVAMLAALGRRESLRSHISGALNHGATPEQIVETLKMVSAYAGFPAAVEAWPVMEEVFAERGIARPGGAR